MTTAPPTHALPPTVLGYPRIGPDREIKKALEAHWGGGDVAALIEAITSHRRRTLDHLVGLGLEEESAVPADGAVIDQVLDASVLLGLVPRRFRDAGFAAVAPDAPEGLTLISALARGTSEVEPLELTKWFDTNYHYYVPEIEADVAFAPQAAALTDRFRAFRELAEQSDRTVGAAPLPRPTLLGPVSFLVLAKSVGAAAETSQAARFDRLEELVGAYAALLGALHEAGAAWIQLEEPVLSSDGWDIPREQVIAGISSAYEQLGRLTERPALFVPVSYGTADDDALAALGGTAVEAVGIDLERGALPSAEALRPLAGTTLAAGVVGGLNVWRTDVSRAAALLDTLGERHQGPLTVSSSTSLQHVPHDAARETQLDPQVAGWLAFADQKVGEVLALAGHLTGGADALEGLRADDAARRRLQEQHPQVRVESVRSRLTAVEPQDRRRAEAEHRRAAQETGLGLPPLPTTTIGSFPQTGEIRRIRAAHRRGSLDQQGYEEAIREQIADCVRRQEDLGLDVLVHGEAERNDMVQYFAENLEGFITTTHGWVQSYGSRCLRPPILFGDVHRPAPITVDWIRYAASLTKKPVKGMLTGPVTILAWSFVRDDQPLADTADQIALALRDEVQDLQAAGVKIIQVDEPALRELLPLQVAERPDYLRWSVDSFRLSTSGANAATQLHTHLCYSEFETVIDAIDALDADVTTLEASRSGFEVVSALSEHGFSRGIGPGVWDIHSPRVPGVDELIERLRLAAEVLGTQRVWSNPDCGLKTRGWKETEASLRHLVNATAVVRAELAAKVPAGV
ncbi:5-methyltetrahydropteroyltriglutamate--homocysteine S-methyltransferase [Nesterenkonia sp. HG001]|uniref:5-methyltetrahydropteroyltriglutamate-- homocysteine S-methyltransferase n=1 Tax=Nesterenkonia sp. HG001 TaxID=2983207 RepID=UPI002AC5E3F7|nr:5-methyltetrahydropteroyltriglutamate--homocysteine S-methyltransferase [Nesterenkonia sp. HG001]MDZ5077742.1 5-methyltetrahydropteroyltriglutamate--homocysteine S-methyltransferase [Nesterenkonia sp. HG001]